METIKEEKKADLEQLLNSLIAKGWKPFGRKKTLHITIYDCDLNVYLDGGFMNEDKKSFRELVSKESGLWQFVCKNGYNQYKKEYRMGYTKYNTKAEYWDEGDYEYYLIESALKDESELESFILDNIKV